MKNLIAALIGAAVGAVVTWQYAKRHFEQIANEEIESMRESMAQFESRHGKSAESETEDKESPAEISYRQAVEHYTKSETPAGPRVIDYDKFCENQNYVRVTYVYFEDGVVLNEQDDIVNDVEEAIGTEFQEHFADNDDVVYVVNDTRHCYYEILRDGRPFYGAQPPVEG